MINIKNTQKKVAIDTRMVRTVLCHILQIIGYDSFSVSVWFSGTTTIRAYNRKYRGKDAPTDILSFGALEHPIPGKPPVTAQSSLFEAEEELYLGDLVIAPLVVQQAAEEKKIAFDDHLVHLLIHGVCHLIGYDHVEDVDYRRMRAKEVFILKKLQNEDKNNSRLYGQDRTSRSS